MIGLSIPSISICSKTRAKLQLVPERREKYTQQLVRKECDPNFHFKPNLQCETAAKMLASGSND